MFCVQQSHIVETRRCSRSAKVAVTSRAHPRSRRPDCLLIRLFLRLLGRIQRLTSSLRLTCANTRTTDHQASRFTAANNTLSLKLVPSPSPPSSSLAHGISGKPTGWDWSNWTPLTSLSLSCTLTPQAGFASYASFYSTACLAPCAYIPALTDFLIPNSRAAVRGRRRRLTPLTHRLKPVPPRPPSIHDDGSATIG